MSVDWLHVSDHAVYLNRVHELSKEIHDCAETLRREDRRHRWLASRVFIQDLLRQVDVSLQMITAPNSPIQIQGGKYFVSVSHSEGWLGVAHGPEPLGFDVEVIRDVTHMTKIARRYFFADDFLRWSSIEYSLDQRREFFRLWTRFEAAAKLSHQGIARADLSHKSFRFLDVAAPDGLIASVALLRIQAQNM